MTTIEATITNDCTCEVYDEETDSTKLDEYGYPARPDYCYGDCYTESVSDFMENLVKPFAEQKGWKLDDPIKVEANGLTWQGLTGHAFTTLERLVDTLSINGDYRLEFQYDTLAETLTARRYSHDEPVGTGVFQLTHYLPCVKCEDPIQADIHAEELGMCVDCSNDYYDHKDE